MRDNLRPMFRFPRYCLTYQSRHSFILVKISLERDIFSRFYVWLIRGKSQMKLDQFLSHHGIEENPFVEEDAQSDTVFKNACIDYVYHPAWEKIFGNPKDPSTAIVFGEKGSGKTALGLQIRNRLSEMINGPDAAEIFTVEYDDFNPFLDRFQRHLDSRSQGLLGQFFGKSNVFALGEWKLKHHMDAIISLAVSKLTDLILRREEMSTGVGIPRQKLRGLGEREARALLLLSSVYDTLSVGAKTSEWKALAKILEARRFSRFIPIGLGLLGTFLCLACSYFLFGSPALLAAAPIFWAPWLIHRYRVLRTTRKVTSELGCIQPNQKFLQAALKEFRVEELDSLFLPTDHSEDRRYQCFATLKQILEGLGYRGLYILIDRVDEPHQINGSSENMSKFIWPLLDNKFLTQRGMGLKMMLPIELKYALAKENRDFNASARLDKHNVTPDLVWTGETLYEIANARVAACCERDSSAKVNDLFEDDVDIHRLTVAFAELRVPRHLFKFLYRVLSEHCVNNFGDKPSFKISKERFETSLALYKSELSSFDHHGGGLI